MSIQNTINNTTIDLHPVDFISKIDSPGELLVNIFDYS